MNNKKVSIIIPSFNNEKYVDDCIRSALAQTYQNIEIIVIDDGSTDNSLNIIKKYEKNNVVVVNQFHQNASIARNRGIELSTGDYLYFLDSDDMISDDDVIENMVLNIQENDLVIYDYEKIDNNGNHVNCYFNEPNLLPYEGVFKYAKLSPVLTNKLYRKDVIKNNDLHFANVRIGQDLNFYLKYLSCIEKVKLVHREAYKYRINPKGMTNSANFNVLDICNSFENVLDFYKKNKKEKLFNKYLRTVGVNHFLMKFAMIRSFEKSEQRRIIFDYFDYYIKEYLKLSLLKDEYYKKQVSKYRLIRLAYKTGIYAAIKRRG